MAKKTIRIGLLWIQFSAYHKDRCEAAARRLSDRCVLRAVQVSTKSVTYAWEPTDAAVGTEAVTLFPGQVFEEIPVLKRLWAQYQALRVCQMVGIGIPYSEAEVILLAWMLRLSGVRVIMMSATKYDDFPRRVWFEILKGMLLSVYRGAIVGGRRQAEYLRFLGFRRRPVLPGYNSVGLDRVRRQGLEGASADIAYADRHFVFVGRFIAKKHLPTLLAGYASYVAQAGSNPRRLKLVGSGDLQAALEEQARTLGIAHLVDFLGFLTAPQVARVLAHGLALALVSEEEQWGLVVNEALAFGLPILASSQIGANDVLTRNLLNGFVVELGSVEGIAHAMLELAGNEQLWNDFAAESRRRAWMADTERFADAVELLMFPGSEPAATNMGNFMNELRLVPSQA